MMPRWMKPSREAGVNDADFKRLLDAANINKNVVDQAVADVLTVRRLDSFAADTLSVSVLELEHLAVDTTASTQVRYIVLDTSAQIK